MTDMAHPLIEEEEINAVNEVLKSGMLVQGEKVKELEDNFAKFTGTNYAVAVGNGTQALHVALLANDIKPGDEVITTPFSFIASTNSILMCNAKPVFVDIDPKTYNINPDLIEDAITDKTKAILPVHLYGQTCNMDKLEYITSEYNLKLIEDACQAHGAEYDGKKAGNFGDAGCFSFYATKNMCCGEGGIITTNNKEIAEKSRLLRSHGEVRRYDSAVIGYNFRMTNLAAAIGVEQLKKLPKFNQKRRNNATLMTNLTKKYAEGVVTPIQNDNNYHVYHQYTLRITDDYKSSRDDLVSKLQENNIGSKVFYPIPLHKMPHVKQIVGDVSCPEAELASKQVLSVPIHPSVSFAEVEKIAARVCY